MAIGEKIVEIGLAGASAAIATFAIYLWGQTEVLERRIGDLQSQIEKIEKVGEVEMARIEECRELSLKIIWASENFNVASDHKELFDQRGCNLLKAAK